MEKKEDIYQILVPEIENIFKTFLYPEYSMAAVLILRDSVTLK
jgi:hypothetical protein